MGAKAGTAVSNLVFVGKVGEYPTLGRRSVDRAHEIGDCYLHSSIKVRFGGRLAPQDNRSAPR